MDIVSLIILVPVLTGLVFLAFPGYGMRLKGMLSLLTALVTLYWSWVIFQTEPSAVTLLMPELSVAGDETVLIMQSFSRYLQFSLDGLSQLIVLLTGGAGLIISIYSLRGITSADNIRNFHAYFLITLGLSMATIMADNLLLFIFLWGMLGLTLYKLIPAYDQDGSAAAKKTLIMIGSSDGIMIIGIAILFNLTSSLTMSNILVETNSLPAYTAFIALIIGSFTKAGAFPFHSWIPEYSRKAPAASSAYLPASLDKLLGIYFLVRISHHMFIMSDVLRLLILVAGAGTIITAVMMALVQHDYKKLLGFHAVSQVGYMVIGIGLGSIVGLAAGLFHMLNHAIYKSGLFMVAGNIKTRTGDDSLDGLGGLSKKMPVTFFAALIFALSISGVPPFNGFASKWMIYQGIIDFGSGTSPASRLWILWLAVAVSGSALTLASFMKFISGAFWGNLPEKFQNIKEAGITMLIPIGVLALLCIGLGVFATEWVIPELFIPIAGEFEFTGVWQSTTVSALIMFSILLGALLYLATATGKFRREESFTGGEKLSDDRGFPVTGFYGTVRNAPILSGIYEKADKGRFDLYELSKGGILWINNIFSAKHDGVLQTYLAWVFGGLIIILLILL